MEGIIEQQTGLLTSSNTSSNNNTNTSIMMVDIPSTTTIKPESTTNEETPATPSPSTNTTSTSTTTTTTTATPTPDITTYLNIYNHAIRCTQLPTCSAYSRCLQFRRIMQHARHCVKNKLNECNVCRQLIALTIMHARSCRDETCPAPYCASIKARLDELNEMRARVESAYEYVRACFVLLDYTPKRTIALQTIVEQDDGDAGDDQQNKMDLDEQTSNSAVEQIESERAKLIAEIERVKKLDTTAPNRTNRLKMDVKFSKELAKFVFKKLMSSHQLTDKCYSSIQYARLARIFMLENLALLRKVFSSSPSTIDPSTSAIDHDEYLVLVIDLAHRFDRMLAKHTKLTNVAECQTESELLDIEVNRPSEKRRRDDCDQEVNKPGQVENDDESTQEAKKLRSV